MTVSGQMWSRVILPWDVWASDVLAIDGELFVVSTAGGGDLILHWDGAVWTLEPLDDRDAVQIVGRSADEVFNNFLDLIGRPARRVMLGSR